MIWKPLHGQIRRCFASSSKGFIRSGVGLVADSMDTYVDKSIVQENIENNLKAMTLAYLQAVSEADTEAIKNLTKKQLCAKSLAWIAEIKSKGEYLSLPQFQEKSFPQTISLECFTTFSYLYGVCNEVQTEKTDLSQDNRTKNSSLEKNDDKNSLENPQQKGQLRVFDIRQQFLVKRILYVEGLKFWKVLRDKSLVAEAIIYTNAKISLKSKKDSKNSSAISNNTPGSYVGYKICFVCETDLWNLTPPAVSKAQNGKENLSSKQQQINESPYFQQNTWRIADINDWVFGETQTQDFPKWAVQAAINEPPTLKQKKNQEKKQE